jgi:hypothetical protein
VVQKKIKTIVWSKNAVKQYYGILDYLTEEAPEAIAIVGNALLDTIESLATDTTTIHPTGLKKAMMVHLKLQSYSATGFLIKSLISL